MNIIKSLNIFRRLQPVITRTYIAPDLLDPSFKQKTPEQIKQSKDDKKIKIKLLTDLLQKRIDIELFESNVLVKERIIIEPVRLRHHLDTLSFLKSRQEVVGVIKPRDEEPPVYFVLDYDQVRALAKQTQIYSRPVFIKIGEDLVQCTVHDIRRSIDNVWYTKVYFNRYIIGQPNEIKVALDIQMQPHDKYLKKKLEWNVKSVLLLASSDIYPPKMLIDPVKLVRKGAYTFGDLLNQLPAGLELHPKFMRNLNFPIAYLEDLYSKREQDYMYIEEKLDFMNKEMEKRIRGTTESSEEKVRYIELYSEGTKKTDRKTKTRSIKKLLKSEQDKLRAELEKINLEAQGEEGGKAGDSKKGK